MRNLCNHGIDNNLNSAVNGYVKKANENSNIRVFVFGSKGFPGQPGAGGVETGVNRLTAELSNDGMKIIVYSRGYENRWRHKGKVLIRDIKYINSKNNAFWSHSVLSFIDYLFVRKKGDVIHLHCIQNAFLSPLFKVLGHKVIFHLHGQEWRVSKWHWTVKMFMKLSIFPMMYFSDIILTVCNESKDTLSSIYSNCTNKMIVLPNGVPTIQECNQYDSQKILSSYVAKPNKYWLFVGRLVQHKKIDIIIRALQLSDSSFDLLIAGSPSHTPEYLSYLMNLTDRLGLSKRVKFLGQLSSSKLNVLYRNCRAVVLPSEFEGCSNVLLEAVSMSAPIICTDLSENKSILKNYAYYISVNSVDDLVDAFQWMSLTDNFKHQRKMIRTLQAELLSWEEIACKLKKIYLTNTQVKTHYL